MDELEYAMDGYINSIGPELDNIMKRDQNLYETSAAKTEEAEERLEESTEEKYERLENGFRASIAAATERMSTSLKDVKAVEKGVATGMVAKEKSQAKQGFVVDALGSLVEETSK